jgi:hypothetical protein
MAQPRIVFWVAALLPVAIAGNAAPQRQTPEEKWADVIQLAPGTVIRVTLSGGNTIDGTLQTATADSLAVQAAASQEKFMRTEIAKVQVKGKGRRGRRVLIGLAIGAGGGLAIGAAVDSHDKRSQFNIVPNAGKEVFTPLGAILGAIVGVAIPAGGWREVYRAP